jgi:membrane-associated protease RseP (regulator of RpoE activity)
VRLVTTFGLIAVIAMQSQAWSQEDQGGLEFDQRINGPTILDVAEPIRELIQRASAVIYDGQEVVAYGVVMSSTGDIITKASELTPDKGYTVRLDGGVFENVKPLIIDQESDVALIHVDTPSAFVPDQVEGKASIGTIVVSNGATSRKRRRIRLGIISANARPIQDKLDKIPYIGLSFQPPTLIAEVVPESPAAEVGLCPNDKILTMDSVPVKTLDELGAILQGKHPGDSLQVKVEREGREVEVEMVLSSRAKFMGETQKATVSKEDLGMASARRDSFPEVIQHDSPLSPNGMGGPLFDLDGHLLGMNIARANRAETYALPVSVMNNVYKKLLKQLR